MNETGTKLRPMQESCRTHRTKTHRTKNTGLKCRTIHCKWSVNDPQTTLSTCPDGRSFFVLICLQFVVSLFVVCLVSADSVIYQLDRMNLAHKIESRMQFNANFALRSRSSSIRLSASLVLSWVLSKVPVLKLPNSNRTQTELPPNPLTKFRASNCAVGIYWISSSACVCE